MTWGSRRDPMPPAGPSRVDVGVCSLTLYCSRQQGRPMARSHWEADTSSLEGGSCEQLNGTGNLVTCSAGGCKSAGHSGTDRLPQPPELLLTGV